MCNLRSISTDSTVVNCRFIFTIYPTVVGAIAKQKAAMTKAFIVGLWSYHNPMISGEFWCLWGVTHQSNLPMDTRVGNDLIESENSHRRSFVSFPSLYCTNHFRKLTKCIQIRKQQSLNKRDRDRILSSGFPLDSMELNWTCPWSPWPIFDTPAKKSCCKLVGIG